MTSYRIRPRFQQIIATSPKEAQRRIQAYAQDHIDCHLVNSVPGHLTLKIPLTEQHYWSPQLNLTFEEDDEGTLVRGLYGPNPTVWLLFLFGYGTLGTAALFIGIIGFSQKNLGIEAPILWVLPALLIAAVVLYFIAQFGQKIGAEQTFTLHHYYETAVGQRVHVH